jgi:8-oxo-dGTP diphosphatase
LLLERSYGKQLFLNVGGKIEKGETPEGALVRELREECQIEVQPDDLVLFGSYEAPAAGQEDRWLRMDVYMVNQWQGEITPGAEVEELRWVTSKLEVPTGSIFAHEVVPRLKAMGLID